MITGCKGGWTKPDHLLLETNTCSVSWHGWTPNLLLSCLTVRWIANYFKTVQMIWSLKMYNLFPQVPQTLSTLNYCVKEQLPYSKTLRLTLDPPIVPAFAVCQVWRTFSLTCSNSLTRLLVPGYPIRPWLTGLSSLALTNQFTHVNLRPQTILPRSRILTENMHRNARNQSTMSPPRCHRTLGTYPGNQIKQRNENNVSKCTNEMMQMLDVLLKIIKSWYNKANVAFLLYSGFKCCFNCTWNSLKCVASIIKQQHILYSFIFNYVHVWKVTFLFPFSVSSA